jgi:taurine dioxygenase
MAQAQKIDSPSSLNIRPLTGVLGAEIFDLDLTTLDDYQVQVLRSAICRHEVVVIRSQSIDVVEQSHFSRQLGPVGEVPFVATRPDAPDVIKVVKEADEGQSFNFGGAWHSDFSFQQEPPSFTILAAVDLPPWGGDTVFSSMSAAWDELPQVIKDQVLSLQAVHTARDAYSRRMQPLHSGMRGMEIICDDSANAEQRHPLVCRHPETGRLVLFFNRAYVRDIYGMDRSEAETLMAFLHQHTTEARFTYRHRWQLGDVVIWDNRSTQHLALNDYAGFRRELNRTTVAGSRPQSADSSLVFE